MSKVAIRISSPQTGATLPGECCSVPRLCAATSWPRARIYNLLKAGEIEGFLVGGRRYITTASVREFIRRCKRPTEANPESAATAA